MDRVWRYFENNVKDLRWIRYDYKKKKRVENDCKVFRLSNKKMDLSQSEMWKAVSRSSLEEQIISQF